MSQEHNPQFEPKISKQEETQQFENALKVNQNKEEIHDNEPNRVKIIDKRAIEGIYRDLGYENVEQQITLKTIADNLGHIYHKVTGNCRFKVFKGTPTRCEVNIKFENMDENENDWKKIICINDFPHTHPSPILNVNGFKDWNGEKMENEGEIFPSSIVKISQIRPKDISSLRSELEIDNEIKGNFMAIKNEAEEISLANEEEFKNGEKDIKKIGGIEFERRSELRDECLHFGEEIIGLGERKREKGNQATQLRVLTQTERQKCLHKFSKNSTMEGIILIDNSGHFYGPQNTKFKYNNKTFKCTTFQCKFAEWNTNCKVEIYANSKVMKQGNSWTKIYYIKNGHNHKSPVNHRNKVLEPGLQMSNKTLSNTSPLMFGNETSIEGSNPTERSDISIETQIVGEQESNYSPEIKEIQTPRHKRMRIETVAENVKQREKEAGRKSQEINRITSNFVEQTFESSSMLKATAFVGNCVTTQTQFNPTLTSFNTSQLPKSAMTSSIESLTQLRHSFPSTNVKSLQLGQFNNAKVHSKFRSTRMTERQFLLPAWTNCTECKACVLIDPKSTTKDLIATAKSHICQFHGSVNIVTKEMINHHLPHILNLREMEQTPVSESLPVNKEGDYWCSIPFCSAKMINMPDLTENDNDLINHVIQKHLAPGENMSSEKFWQCFPVCGPEIERQIPQKKMNIVKLE